MEECYPLQSAGSVFHRSRLLRGCVEGASLATTFTPNRSSRRRELAARDLDAVTLMPLRLPRSTSDQRRRRSAARRASTRSTDAAPRDRRPSRGRSPSPPRPDAGSPTDRRSSRSDPSRATGSARRSARGSRSRCRAPSTGARATAAHHTASTRTPRICTHLEPARCRRSRRPRSSRRRPARSSTGCCRRRAPEHLEPTVGVGARRRGSTLPSAAERRAAGPRSVGARSATGATARRRRRARTPRADRRRCGRPRARR